jgi:hypothetical protein
LNLSSESSDEEKITLVPYVFEDGSCLLSNSPPSHCSMGYSQIEMSCWYCENNCCHRTICEKDIALKELIYYW